MRSGYKIRWTDHALTELSNTYDYLRTNFTETELKKLSVELHQVLQLIQKNPKLFPLSQSTGIRKVVIKKFNTLYYHEMSDTIEVLSDSPRKYLNGK